MSACWRSDRTTAHQGKNTHSSVRVLGIAAHMPSLAWVHSRGLSGWSNRHRGISWVRAPLMRSRHAPILRGVLGESSTFTLD